MGPIQHHVFFALERVGEGVIVEVLQGVQRHNAHQDREVMQVPRQGINFVQGLDVPNEL
jgi:hypothetical protein